MNSENLPARILRLLDGNFNLNVRFPSLIKDGDKPMATLELQALNACIEKLMMEKPEEFASWIADQSVTHFGKIIAMMSQKVADFFLQHLPITNLLLNVNSDSFDFSCENSRGERLAFTRPFSLTPRESIMNMHNLLSSKRMNLFSLFTNLVPTFEAVFHEICETTPPNGVELQRIQARGSLMLIFSLTNRQVQ